MRKASLFVIICFLPFLSFSQDDSTIKKIRKWQIGVSFSPDYSYRVLKPVQYDDTLQQVYNQVNKDLVDSMNLVEKGKMAFTAGISLAYRFNRKFSLTTGLYYSDKGIQSKGFVIGSGLFTNQYIFKKDSYEKGKYYYYELPVSVSYSCSLDSIEKHKIHFLTGAVFCLNSSRHDYISRRWYPYGSSGDPSLESSYLMMYAEAGSVFRIGYILGVGYSYRISDKFCLSVEPVFKYFAHEFFSRKMINWHNRSTAPITMLEVKENPYSFGCNISVGYSF